MTQDATHRIKLGGYLNSVRLRANQTPNQLGTFVFHSLETFAAGRPSSFSRTLAPLDRAGTSWNEALYLGDTWRAGARLQLTYGARLEATEFRGTPARSEEHTSELQSLAYLVCRLLLEKKKK